MTLQYAPMDPVQLLTQCPAPLKRRAACEECRTKKLKCTREQPSCSRCAREHIGCVYSVQKEMGRPKKRARAVDVPTAGRPDAVGEGGGAEVTREQQWPWSSTPFPNTDIARVGGRSGLVDSARGNLQPWLQTIDLAIPNEQAVPELDRDSASDSTPPVNLLSEPAFSRSHSYTQIHSTSPDLVHQSWNSSTDMLIDPSLSDPALATCLPEPQFLPTCACLSTMYLTLSTLESLTTFPFPSALHPLREAMQTAAEIISCPICPTKFLAAIHNTNLVSTLLVSIAERYSKIIQSITIEALRAERSNATKTFRLANVNTGTSAFPANGSGGSADAFSIELTPHEWRLLAKKVVRVEIYRPPSDALYSVPTGPIGDGTAGGSSYASPTSLMALAHRLQERQRHWHGPTHRVPSDIPRTREGRMLGCPRTSEGSSEHACMRLAGHTIKLIEGMDWS
ncbi:hypothetical protein LTR08_008382 [Meristemomyces frigidus]|nr:hypothetical protein LTR08_008382 [Meristemomyces frigidus]